MESRDPEQVAKAKKGRTRTINGLVWPTEGFAWNPDLEARLPLVRGICTGDFEISPEALTRVPEFGTYGFVAELNRKRLVEAGAQLSGPAWTQAEAATALVPERLARADGPYWRQVFYQCAQAQMGRDDQPQLCWAAEVSMGLHGLAFALSILLDAGVPLAKSCWSQFIDRGVYGYFRAAIAAAPEADYLAAREVAATCRGTSPFLDGVICYLFPEMAEWADALVGSPQLELPFWLDSCVMSVTAACRHFGRRYLGDTELSAALLLIEVHGEGALPFLEILLDRAPNRDYTLQVLQIIKRLAVPGMIPTLVRRADRHKEISRVVEQLATKWPAATLRSAVALAGEGRLAHLEGLALRLAKGAPELVETVLADCDEAEGQWLQRLLDQQALPLAAVPEALPELLRNPPWTCSGKSDAALATPARMPKLPAFFVPQVLHFPRLKSGGALPVQAVEYLGNMLSISTLEAPYGGLAVVKEVCTTESLAEFAWDLFEAWQAAGSPGKASWAFVALGLLGHDETARRLAPKIRDWPGEGSHVRAVTGLDILATIGTDVALMHLDGIACKVRFKALQERAREKIAQVAKARGLSREALADRLVPDLGLDATGSLELDFGPRKFYVSFDEALKPFVKDAAGVWLKDLPKPNRKDDETQARVAVERYKAMKKDAKAISSLQLLRLEQAMGTRRRWSPGDFQLFFLDHPLLRHLARRLVWGAYRDDRLVDAFRVAEDLSLADQQDEPYGLPEDVQVGVVHALELSPEQAGNFGQIFADYEILQPFRQLGRETYGLSEEERGEGCITRFKNKRVATGSIMGLGNRGWVRGPVQDGAWVSCFTRDLPDGLLAELELDPGLSMLEFDGDPVQKISRILVRRQGAWDDDGLVSIAGLHPVLVSEILRDGDLLAPAS